ncbi:MAG TPA: EamA family transporter [Puia sp.]|nr:EamA family transporter [Puia sp.]
MNQKPYSSLISQRSHRTKALIAVGLVSFLWGTTWLASRFGVKYVPALQFAAIRQSIAGLGFIFFFLLKGTKWPRGKEWITILILGFLNFFLSNGLTTWGVKYISAGLGAIIAAIFPLWLVIMGPFAGASNFPARRAILGLLLGFGGVCVVFYDHLEDFFNADFRFGIFVSLFATLSWALGTLFTKQKTQEFNPYFSIGLQMFISGISLYLVCGLTGIAIPIHQIPWQSWAAIGYLAVFGSVVSFLAYLYALQNLPTEQVSIYAYINPVVAVILGSVLFGERLTIFIAIGGLITIFGVYLVNEGFRKIRP